MINRLSYVLYNISLPKKKIKYEIGDKMMGTNNISP